MSGIPPGVVPGLAAMVSACPTPALTRPGSELSLVLATGGGMFIGGSWEDGSCVSIITSAELPADTGSVPIGCIS